MRKVHCDGCGHTESDDLLKSDRIIEPVILQLGENPRWAGDEKAIYKADLCSNCLALLLHTYFKIPIEDRLDLAVPTFILPEGLQHESEREAQPTS